MGFGPYNRSLKIQKFIWTPTPKVRTHLGVWRCSLGSVQVHSFTLSHTPGSMKCDSRASLLARTFASPYLGCEPKAKVATITLDDEGTNFCIIKSRGVT
jgi:hypothetical protein